MAKIWAWIHSSMKRKWFVVMATFSICIISVYGVLTYHQTIAGVKEHTERLGERVLVQANLNLNRYLRGYTESLLLLASSKEVREWLPLTPEDRTETFRAQLHISNSFIQTIFFHYPEITAILLTNYNDNRMIFTNNYVDSEKYADYYRRFREQPHAGNIIYSSGIPDYYMNQNKPAEFPVIHIHNRIQYQKQDNWIQLDLNMEPALKILQEMGLGANGEAMIVDDRNRIVAHPDPRRIGTKLPEYLIGGIIGKEGSFVRENQQELILYSSLESMQWKTVVIVPYSEFLPLTSKLASTALWTAGLSVLASILLAHLFSNTFTRRINKLRQAISKTEAGQWKQRIPISGSDEIYELGNTYNRMLERLDSTVEQLTQTSIKEKQATMSALQAQIDSHFLYNTLETINAKAYLANQPEIETMTISLSEMLRYSSGYGQAIVPLREEIDNLHHYLDIIHIRFGDDVKVEIRAEERCLRALCLKAILQPVVENCVKHGLPDENDSLIIRIDIEAIEEAYVQIEVKDNGSGFDPDKLQQLRQQLREFVPFSSVLPRVGILNVHSRFRTIYPDYAGSGVYVENRTDGPGACVRLLFPLDFNHAEGEIRS